MDIAKRDKIIDALRLEIARVRSGMLSQLRDIGEIHKENSFLIEVKEDYKRYKNAMLMQKKREERHLEMLTEYLEKSLMDAGITDSMERQMKFEQKRILESLDNLKNEIDEIISNDNLDGSDTGE